MVSGSSPSAPINTSMPWLATACLEDERLSLAEIAFLLGYADQSAFNHAFRKWTGDSPLRFRKRE